MSNESVNPGLYESYYDHCCSILDTKDVLNTDICGNNACSRLKRWWYGLFLLSCSDERCRTYYMSSHALKMERTRHFRTFRNRIHPLSKFRNFWDIFMFTIFVLELFSFHHNSSITFGHITRYFYYLGAMIDIGILFDVIVNLMTGFVDTENSQIILEKTEGLLHYGSTKLFFHVSSAIPLHWIIILRYGTDADCSICKTNKLIIALTFLSNIRLLRLYETSTFLKRERKNYKLAHVLRFLRIYILGTFTMIQYINMSDIVELVQVLITDTVVDNDYITQIYNLRYRDTAHSITNSELLLFNYVRVGKTILLYNFGNGMTKCSIHKFITLVGVVIIHIFYFHVLFEFFSLISRIRYPEEMMISKQNATENLVSSRQLPEFMIRKTRKYFKYNQAKMKVIENHNSLYRALPLVLKKEIFRVTYLGLITRVPCFSEWPTVIIEDILDIMTEEIYLKGDLVAESGVASEGLLVNAMGELAVYTEDGQETGHLIDGDYFGELSLVTDNELRTSSAVALSPCVILTLDKWIFRKYMRQRPGLFKLMKQQLTNKYTNKIRNEVIT